MTANYLSTLKLAGKLHQRFLDAIRVEMNDRGYKNMNPVQCLIILYIEDGMTIRELRDRCVDGDRNISYNIEHLEKKGLIEKYKSDADHRSIEVRLTDSGRDAQESVLSIVARHEASLNEDFKMKDRNLATTKSTLELIQSMLSLRGSVSS